MLVMIGEFAYCAMIVSQGSKSGMIPIG